MADNTGVTIVSGSGKSVHEAQRLYQRLQSFYGISDLLLLLPKSPADLGEDDKKKRDNRSPFIVGRFDDSETRVDCGTDILHKYVRGRHVIILQDFLDTTQGYSINDKVSEAEGIADVFKHVAPAKITLATGYFPYVRAHSFVKYQKKGLYQTNKLERVVEDLANAGVNEIITIDPHSKLIWEICDQYRVAHQDLNPFQSSATVDYSQLGFKPPFDEIQLGILGMQTPFVTFYKMQRAEGSHGHAELPFLANPFVIVPDEGAYDRGLTFAVDSGIGKDNMMIFYKQRGGPGEIAELRVKDESPLQMKDIEGRNGVLIDDLFASCGTAESIAKEVKEKGKAARVEGWGTHTNNPNPAGYNRIQYIDKLVALETNNQQDEPAHQKKFPILYYISGMTSMIAAASRRSNYLLNLSR